MVEGMKGELFHFKQIDKSMYKVGVSEIFDGLIELYWVSNESDNPPKAAFTRCGWHKHHMGQRKLGVVIGFLS